MSCDSQMEAIGTAFIELNNEVLQLFVFRLQTLIASAMNSEIRVGELHNTTRFDVSASARVWYVNEGLT